jgi:uncharacterized protein involved in exopolysaccharide biosynthesis
MNQRRQTFELSLYDLLVILRRRSGWILGATVVAVLLALLLSFTLTPRYEAMASLLPGRSNAVSTFIPMIERGKIRGGVKFGNVTTRNSHNLEVMASDRLQYRLIEDLDLIDFYPHGETAVQDSGLALTKTLTDLRRDTHFGLSLQLQVLFVRVTTTDPAMSARITNHYLDLLDEVNLERYHHFAANKVRFLDKELKALSATILQAESKLNQFHTRHGLTDLEQERGLLFDLTGRLRQDLLSREVSLARLSSDLTDESPERIELEAEIEIFRSMLLKLETSLSGNSPSDSGDSVDLHDLAINLQRLKRELWLLQAVEEQLIGERESARLQSVLDTGTTTILDRAFVPHDPIWPDRKLMIGLSAALTLFLGGLTAVGIEFILFLGTGDLSRGWRRLLQES